MGIRYYGFSVPPDQMDHLRRQPGHCLHALDTARGPARSEEGYLDKAWSYLQRLFLLTSPDERRPRPAYRLVQGQVRYLPPEYGMYEPYHGILDPTLVRVVAADIETVRPADVARLTAEGLCPRPDDEEYVTQYLQIATDLALDAASRGHGVGYAIQ